MAITVADLLEMQHLRLHLVSGKGGVGRSVSWTHGSDLPEPWRWLTGGELLLTNGMSFPESGAGQRELIEKLDEAGASGLAIGEKMYCPPLTDELLSASERLGLSVLSVEFPMPFVAISQAVAAANLLEQSDRLVRTEKIYRTVQRMVSTHDSASVLREPLAQVLGCEVHVCHRESGEPWYPEDPRFDPVLAGALHEITRGTADLRAGALVVPLDDGRDLRLVDVPTQQGALMVLVSQGRSPVDAILMQHAVTVLALELSQSVVANEHRRRIGAELLAQLLEGRIEARTAARQLRGLGVDPAKARLYAVSGDDAGRLRDVHIALWRNGIGHVVNYRSGVLHVLAPPAAEVHDVLRGDLGAHALIGISAPLRGADRAPEALREAAWALRAAEGSVGRTFHYGDASPIVGVGGLDDAAALVSRVLGPLLEYERVHATPLLATLDAFLGHQRSWQRTADALQVHRQTVLYRIRKVEEITGRSTSETADIAELWLALRAQSLLAPAKGSAPRA
ncbi:PucR family transcriptional regulator [Pimelobacter simplex]|uniref:PucR family transcriptional regulator n=1 Tax=Nocardioides simplex TaxID=2045 RepID=UPI0019333F61|nr:PucR family transcriptional regulator ligand-binding domain-containing protein [Pimelobacter simplex]